MQWEEKDSRLFFFWDPSSNLEIGQNSSLNGLGILVNIRGSRHGSH